MESGVNLYQPDLSQPPIIRKIDVVAEDNFKFFEIYLSFRKDIR